MTPGIPARRSAEHLARALERSDAPSGRATGSHAAAGVDPAWLAVVERLRAVPDAPARPSPDFSIALREQLVTAARTELVARPAGTDPVERLRLAPSRPRGQRRLTAAVAGLALVGASGGVAVAAQGALPGDALYPVKRAMEEARAGLEPGAEQQGTALLAQAGDRLAEIRALSADSSSDPALVDDTFALFVAQAGQASELKLTSYRETGDEGEVDEVRTFSAEGVATLEALEPLVPRSSRPSLLEAASVLWQIDDTARRLCGGCGGPVVDLAPEIALDPVAGVSSTRAAERLAGTTGPERRRVLADEPPRDRGGRDPQGGDRAGQGSPDDDGTTRAQGRTGEPAPPAGPGAAAAEPDVDGPLGRVREGLGGLTGGGDAPTQSTRPGGLGGLLGGALGGGSGAGGPTSGSSGAQSGGAKSDAGSGGGTSGGRTGVGGVLDDVDDELGDLLP